MLSLLLRMRIVRYARLLREIAFRFCVSQKESQPGLKITCPRCGAGDRIERDSVAQPLQAVDKTAFHRLPIPLVEVIAAEVVVLRAVRKQVVDDDEDGVGHRDGGLGAAAAGRPPPILRRQVGVLRAGRGVGGLNQAGPQPGTALTRRAPTALAATLMIPRTEAGPGGQMLRAGEAARVGTDLGNEGFGHRSCSDWSACFPAGSDNRSCPGAPGGQLLSGLAAPG